MPTVNIKAFSHKKSTVVENGGPKLPTAAQLELGEIAINFAKGYETLSIKNNNDEIVTFTNDNYWINKEQAIAAALNDLNDRKQDALEMDEIPTEGSENVVTSGGLYSYITEIEQVTAAALNDLNDRITSLALSDDYAAAAQGTPPLAGDTYETAISKLHKVIVDDELITSSALNDLNSRIDNLSLSEDYEAADPTSEPAEGDTYEEAISKLHGAILENELATAGALNDLNTRISDIVVPELILSEDYEPSSLSNEDLFLEPGDSYETAFAKLEKAINDNENITSAALTDLDSRLNLLHLPQSLDDIPDGSTRKLSDYATTTQLATKQDALVSGTNIKTINNESILGSGNITIEGGDESIITKYAGEIDTHEGRDLGNEPRIFRWIAMNYVFDGCTGGIVVEDSYESSSHVVTYRQTLLGYQKIYYRTSSTTDMSNSNWIESQSGDTNIIESIKVNGTALTPDSNKAVDITVPTESTVTGWGFTKLFVVHTDSEFPTTDGTYNITVDYTGNEITAAYNRGEYPILEFQDKAATLPIIGLNGIVNFGTTVNKISLLVGIPSDSTNANLIVAHCIGPEEISHQSIKFLNTTNTSAQHVNESETIAGSGTINLHKVSKTGSYSDLIKPSGGIPSTDFTSAVQTSLGKADSAIQGVKVNGTALTPDANKAVNITSIPASIVTQDATHRFVSDTEKTTWNGKQNALQHYSESNGVDISTYVNEGDINIVSYDDNGMWPVGGATFGSNGIELNTKQTYTGNNDEIEHTVTLNHEGFKFDNKQIATVDQIPSAVTESTVSDWGFTKNAGTITGITMNGASKGTSGVVDLGTVLTSETDPTVPAWAKASTKPTYTAQEVGALPNTYTPPVTSVNGQTGAVNLTIPSAPGTLNTTATTAQSTSSSEALSGNITLHKVAKTGTYSDLIGKPTIPTVNNATLTIQKNGTTVNTFTANASSNVTANIQVNELPTVSSSDNGKILMVVNGAWSLVTPTAIYSGTSAPDSNIGNNGDIYVQQ